MKLTIGERFAVLGLLPNKASITTIRIVRQLREALSFSEEEHERFKIKETRIDDGKTLVTTWDPKVVEVKEVEFGGVATSIVVNALTRLEKEESITEALISVWDKFISTEVKNA